MNLDGDGNADVDETPLKDLFKFRARWKEELVVDGPGGAFALELPMGVPTAYLPTEEAWTGKAPTWARSLWPQLHAELQRWCAANDVRLEIDPTAAVQTLD